MTDEKGYDWDNRWRVGFELSWKAGYYNYSRNAKNATKVRGGGAYCRRTFISTRWAPRFNEGRLVEGERFFKEIRYTKEP